VTATDVIPTSAAELEEMLLDKDRMKPIAKDPALYTEFIKAYANAQQSLSALAEAKVEFQRFQAEWLRDHGQTDEVKRLNLAATVDRTAGRGKHYNPEAPGAAIDGKFKNLGDLTAALYRERNGVQEAQQRLGQIRNDFSSVVPSDGGFLVPEEFRAQLMEMALETAIVRPRAQVIPMAVPRVKIPFVYATSNASSVFGGFVGYWTEEAAELVASSMKFGSITLDANKITLYTEVPNELLRDSPISVDAMLRKNMPGALSWFEDVAFHRGTGVGEPLGYLTAGNTARVTVAKETGQAANTIVFENVVKMFARMLPSSLSRAVWIANINTIPELATMALSVGTGGGPIWVQTAKDGLPLTLMGRPIVFTEKADTLGTAGDLNFVDLGYYLIGDRQQIELATSEHIKFNHDTTAYRAIERIDGRPGMKTAITPHKGADALSPFVSLAPRA